MSYILDHYTVFYNNKIIGYYYTFSDHTVRYSPAWGCPWDMEDKLNPLGLDKEIEKKSPIKLFSNREIPEEWFALPYEDFLENVVTLAAASHYGFTAEMLLKKAGLKEFFGFGK